MNLFNSLSTVFSTTSLYNISLNFFKSTGTGYNLSASSSANLSTSNLLTSDFKLTKSAVLAN